MTVATTAQTQKAATSQGFGAMALVAFIGLGLIALTGHVQASALHDAAHDVRHATGFPCH